MTIQSVLRQLRSGMVLDGVALKPAEVHYNERVCLGTSEATGRGVCTITAAITA